MCTEQGFKVCVIDNVNKSNEAQYWKDDFLKLVSLADEYHHTKEFLSMTKAYATEQFTKDFEVSKTDQINLLNRSINYFKNNHVFNKTAFEEEVLHHPETIESFRSFDEQYPKANFIDIQEEFDISKQAVRKQSRVYKSVLKLDRNFHIYIHGNRDMIERGIDEQGRKYYKIYFEEEQ